MSKLILYHGTSEENAKHIEKEGFRTDHKYNWDIKSKKGFVYLSSAYAPFYAIKHDTNKLAIIKCEVDTKDLYPEDDFIMLALGKPKYTQEELDAIDLKIYKKYYGDSLKYMGNCAIKPSKIKILRIGYFDGKHLMMKCDPVINPMNFKYMGEYYKELSEWLFQGKKPLDFRNFMDMVI